MTGLLVDSNVILDIFENDPHWVEWSESMLYHYSLTHALYINPIIYSEVSIGFARIEESEEAFIGCGLQMIQIPTQGKSIISSSTHTRIVLLPAVRSVMIKQGSENFLWSFILNPCSL